LFKLFDIDLKKLNDIQKQVIGYNIFFPGAGFFFASKYLTGLCTGGTAIILLCLGIVTIAHEFPKNLRLGIVLLSSTVIFHFVAIVASVKVTKATPNKFAMYLFIIFSLIVILISCIFLIKDLLFIATNFSFSLH
jgi:hypothetical protein